MNDPNTGEKRKLSPNEIRKSRRAVKFIRGCNKVTTHKHRAKESVCLRRKSLTA